MGKHGLSGFLILLIHGKVYYPANLKAVFVHHFHSFRHFTPDKPREFLCVLLIVGDKVQNVSHIKPRTLLKLLSVSVGKKFVNGSEIVEVFINLYIAKSLHANGQSVFLHLLEERLAL